MASDLSPPAKKAVGNLRNTLIALEAASGATLPEIAEKFRTTPTGVRRSLEKSAREGLLNHYTAAIAADLLPQALAVYSMHLQAGSLEAARDLVVKLGWMSKMPSADDPGKKSALDILSTYRTEAGRPPDAPPEAELPPPVPEVSPVRLKDLWDAPEPPSEDSSDA